MLNWLAETVSVFKIQHNAHREFHMSVDQHLAHRTRIGNAPLFLNARDQDLCSARNTLWELRVVLLDGRVCDLAGSTLENCIRATQDLLATSEIAIAA